MGETTPPPEEDQVPEDNFPKVYSMTSGAYTKRGLPKSKANLSASKSSLNSEEEENKPPAAKKEKDYDPNNTYDKCSKDQGITAGPKMDDEKLYQTHVGANYTSDQATPAPSTPLSESAHNVSNLSGGQSLGTKPVCEDIVPDVTDIPKYNDKDVSMNNSDKSFYDNSLLP